MYTGPEDLVAAELMLKRLTAPGAQFSQPFVDEFKIFMKELREFFNASGGEGERERRRRRGEEEARGVGIRRMQPASLCYVVG